jgi:thiol-disulfide isomerase/thioredoxin
MAELKGKVVLVDFWTYTCINCIRTLPFVTGWYEKYKDQGFVVVGVHTPEFEFEKKTTNVQMALDDYHITYPVVQDNDYKIWNAYNNNYWPAHYFIDKNGHIRHTHFGEGSYEESEKFIQRLLAEDGTQVETSILDMEPETVQTRSPETYLGYGRIEFFASPEKVKPDLQTTYSIPTIQPNNTFAYGGNWMIGKEYASAAKDAELQLKFESKNVYLVMRPKDGAKSGKIEVFLDDKLVEDGRGLDVAQDSSTVTVTEDRIYTIIQLSQPGKHALKLKFLDENIEVFAFTFG